MVSPVFSILLPVGSVSFLSSVHGVLLLLGLGIFYSVFLRYFGALNLDPLRFASYDQRVLAP